MKHTAKALTLTGFAGAVAFAGGTQAYGAIVNLTDPSNITGHAANTAGSAKEYYNVLTGVTTSTATSSDDLEFGYYNNSSTNEFFTGVAGLKAGGYAAGYYASNGTVYSYPIPKGAAIGSSGAYAFNQKSGYFTIMSLSVGGNQYGFGTENEPVYLGFQFLDGNDGLLHDGWLELDSETYTSASNPGGLIFLAGAYNNVADSNGGSILAGQSAAVPEPGTLGALAAGAAALVGVGLKRRRKAALAA